MLIKLQQKLIVYSIDIVNREYASGWCFHRLFRQSPTCMRFFQGDKLVGETRSDLFREDLKDQNLHATGYCGFECVFSHPLEQDSELPMRIYINNSKHPICEIPANQVLEVFKPDDNPIFFMHIPKTAGTSFNNYIRQYFGYQMSQTHIETELLSRQQELAAHNHYLAGHITLEHIPNIFAHRQGVHRHTMIRQPLKQLHSHIAWVKGIALDQKGDFFKKHHSLVQDMGRDLFQTDLANPSNLRELANNLDGFQIDFFDNIQTRYFLDYRPDRVTQSDCDNAIANIKNFKTIGLTESFNQYIGEFCDFYGIQQKPLASIHNPSKVKPLFDVNQPELRAAIEPLVQYDLQLYEEIVRQKNS